LQNKSLFEYEERMRTIAIARTKRFVLIVQIKIESIEKNI